MNILPMEVRHWRGEGKGGEMGGREREGVEEMKDLEEEVCFGVGVISRSGVCRPPHLPGQAGVDLVLIVAHRELIILSHATQHLQYLHSPRGNVDLQGGVAVGVEAQPNCQSL